MLNFHFQSLRTNLLELIELIKNDLPAKDIKEALEFVEYNEFGCSFELICTQLFEYDAKLSDDIYNKIESIGQSMNLNEKVWKILKN